MSDSVYKVVMLIGTSPESWEKAAKAAVEAASQSPARTPHSRGRQAGHGDHGWQGGGLQDEGSSILQI